MGQTWARCANKSEAVGTPSSRGRHSACKGRAPALFGGRARIRHRAHGLHPIKAWMSCPVQTEDELFFSPRG